MSQLLILAEVNQDNIHKHIIDGMYGVKFISFTSMDSLVSILTCIFYDKAKRLFHECSTLNCQTLLSWLHLHIHSLMTFPSYPWAGSWFQDKWFVDWLSVSLPEHVIYFLYFLFNWSIFSTHTRADKVWLDSYVISGTDIRPSGPSQSHWYTAVIILSLYIFVYYTL